MENHFIDTKIWVEKVINSCVTYNQTKTANKLIDNFYNLMMSNEVDVKIRCDIERDLKYKLLLVQKDLNPL